MKTKFTLGAFGLLIASVGCTPASEQGESTGTEARPTAPPSGSTRPGDQATPGSNPTSGPETPSATAGSGALPVTSSALPGDPDAPTADNGNVSMGDNGGVVVVGPPPAPPAPPPCTGAAVTVTRSGTRYTLDNGVVQAVVEASNATLPSFKFKGIETMQQGGYFTFGTNVYSAGPFTGELSADPADNGGSMAEVAMKTTWNGADGVIPFDIEIRYALPQCSQGVYEYVVLTHPTDYPTFTPGEMRINHYIQWDDLFDWYAIDDVRRGLFLSEEDAAAAQIPAGAPREVFSYATGPFSDRPGWQKYDNTTQWNDGNVYGWSSTSRGIGLWIINPSNEYLAGGPFKTELTLHDAGTGRAALLNYWGGSHFNGGFEPPQAGEFRQKAIGPWLLYANSTDATGSAAHDALWDDAKQRLAWEKAAWPYSWESDPRYPPASARGVVAGQIDFADPEQPAASVANAWVGLAGPPVDGKPNFEHQAWDYQYWVQADADGKFWIPSVRPGSYTLHAFAAGIHGVYRGQTDAVTVTADDTNNLGRVTWTADRQGPTVWEIGTPDRTPGEFLHGNEAFQYGVSLLFDSDFPDSVNYTIGSSSPARDWNYLQPAGTWNVQFDVAAIPAGATAASLVLDLASADGVTLTATINGTGVGSADMPYDDGAIDRDQPHGVLRSARFEVPLAELEVGTNTLTIASTDRLMWDYLRLEWVMP